jgi:hypothetical protein
MARLIKYLSFSILLWSLNALAEFATYADRFNEGMPLFKTYGDSVGDDKFLKLTAIDPSGNIYSAANDVVVKQFSNGGYDSNFAVNGTLRIIDREKEVEILAIYYRDSGLIVISQYAEKIQFEKYTDTGERDTEFGVEGIISTDISGIRKVKLVGQHYYLYGSEKFIRFDETFIYDSEFGDKCADLNCSNSYMSGAEIGSDKDNNIYVVSIRKTNSIYLFKLDESGRIISSSVPDLGSSSYGFLDGVTVTKNEELYVFGSSRGYGYIIKFNDSLAIDNSFYDGQFDYGDFPKDVSFSKFTSVLEKDGNILAAGKKSFYNRYYKRNDQYFSLLEFKKVNSSYSKRREFEYKFEGVYNSSIASHFDKSLIFKIIQKSGTEPSYIYTKICKLNIDSFTLESSCFHPSIMDHSNEVVSSVGKNDGGFISIVRVVDSDQRGNYNRELRAVSYLSTGGVDPDFGHSGVIVLDAPYWKKLKLEKHGQGYIYRYSDGNYYYIKKIGKYGNQDISFGKDGEIKLDFNQSVMVQNLWLMADKGTFALSSSCDAYKFDSNGILDNSFYGNGVVKFTLKENKSCRAIQILKKSSDGFISFLIETRSQDYSTYEYGIYTIFEDESYKFETIDTFSGNERVRSLNLIEGNEINYLVYEYDGDWVLENFSKDLEATSSFPYIKLSDYAVHGSLESKEITFDGTLKLIFTNSKNISLIKYKNGIVDNYNANLNIKNPENNFQHKVESVILLPNDYVYLVGNEYTPFDIRYREFFTTLLTGPIVDGDFDLVTDDKDAFPSQVAVSLDSDNDGIPDAWNANCNQACQNGSGIELDIYPNDYDNDGVIDDVDVFPEDPSEASDSDGDGVGDTADLFPNDASEWFDSDGDGVGDNSDAYPNDPYRNELPAQEGPDSSEETESVSDSSENGNQVSSADSGGSSGGGHLGLLTLLWLFLLSICSQKKKVIRI